jgi:hypothetical protein
LEGAQAQDTPGKGGAYTTVLIAQRPRGLLPVDADRQDAQRGNEQHRDSC